MKKFIKENWFKTFIVIVLAVIVLTYILGNRYYFMETEQKHGFGKVLNGEQEIILKCDRFTGKCEKVY